MHLNISIRGIQSLFTGLLLFWALAGVAQDETMLSLSDQLESVTDDSTRVDILNRISTKHLDLNQLDKSFKVSNEAMNLANIIKYKRGKADALRNIALYYNYTNRFRDAIANYDASRNIYVQMNDSARVADMLDNAGGVYYTLGSYDTALIFLKNSKQIRMKLGGEYASSNTCNMIGLVNFTRGQFEEALGNFMESMQVCQAEGNSLDMSLTYCYIGMVYFKLQDYSQAEEYLYIALELNKKYGPTRDIIDVYIQLGQLFRAVDRKAESIQMFENGLSLARYYTNQRKLGECLNGLGSVYHDLKDYKNALTYYDRALDIFAGLDIKNGVLVTSTGIARVYIQLIEARRSRQFNDFTSSIMSEQEIFSLLGNSVNMAKGSGKFDDLVMAYETLILASATFKKYDKAVDYQREFIQFKDSVAGINQNRSIAELKTRFERDQKEQEIAVLNSQRKVQETVMKRQHLERVIYMIGGSTLLLLIILLVTRLSFIRRTRNELQVKNQQIEEEKKRAEQSEAVKEQFLAKMSHEIRIPMNTIMGSVNIILKNKHLSGQKKYLKAINQSSENLIVIINDILDLSKLEAGKITLEKEPFNIREEIKNVEQILKFKAQEKRIGLVTHIDADLPEYVLGDATRLTQVLINLAGNGIKFTEKGKVTISAGVRELGKDSVTLHFAVEDTGIGIPSDRLDKIFRSFTQADSDTTRKYGGTGLGLTISKQLLELQDSTISVTSEPGKGSRFAFDLTYPIGEIEESHDSDFELLPDKMSGLRILVVEDDEFNVMIVSDTLTAAMEDVVLEVAVDGKQAFQKWSTMDFDVVLMDIELPEMNGHEVTRAIRQSGNPRADIPIIAMTANAMMKEVEACFESGMNDYVSKPFDADDLILKINSLLINQKNA